MKKQINLQLNSCALKISCLLLTTLLLSSCASSLARNDAFRGGKTIYATEGWKNKNTYILVVSGQWDRARYYIEESGQAQDGKEAKPGIILAQSAMRAAQEQAKRNFLERVVGSMVKAETGTVDGKLVKDVINSGVSGRVPSPSVVIAQYTPRHDVRVTYQFQAKNLKKLMDASVKKIIADQQK